VTLLNAEPKNLVVALSESIYFCYDFEEVYMGPPLAIRRPEAMAPI
jgi:hypothetical protein